MFVCSTYMDRGTITFEHRRLLLLLSQQLYTCTAPIYKYKYTCIYPPVGRAIEHLVDRLGLIDHAGQKGGHVFYVLYFNYIRWMFILVCERKRVCECMLNLYIPQKCTHI